MATVGERVSVLETQQKNIDEKIDDIKSDVKELDIKIDKHNESLKEQLKTMYDASCTQHAELAKKISTIEKFRDKWIYIGTGGIAVGAWMVGHFDLLSKFVS